MKSIVSSLFLLVLLPSLFAAQPNVLVIIADDLGYADIGVHGGKEVPTPYIDALSVSGVRCTNGYVTAPYSSPSRAGFSHGEGGIRVPFFVSWPGHLPAGKTYDHPVSAMGVLPTAMAVDWQSKPSEP